jgi:2-polyprenyl-3-methyl-5-hydroxy-6-metoxy-1,4-benzoquinol methylase
MNNNFEYEENLENIARTYHLGGQQDMYIEEAGQEFEWPWIAQRIKEKSRILDLGYGDGHSFNNLKKDAEAKDWQITLVEGASSLVTIAQLNASERIKVEHAFFEDFTSPESFDVIIASHVLEHVEDPVALLKHLGKLLSKNGIIIGIVPNRESIHRRLAVILGIQPHLDSLSDRDHLVGHRRVYSLETLSSDFQMSGWKVLEVRGFFLKPFANSQLLHLDLKVIDSLLKISDDLPVEMCANIAFVCQREDGEAL